MCVAGTSLCLLPSSTITYIAPEKSPVEVKAVLTIPEKIAERAIELKVNPTLAVEIARAESRFRPDAKNPKSTATGIYQFLDGTFKTYCIKKYELTDTMEEKNDPDIQIECALQMIKDGGVEHWDASKTVWNKNI